MGVRPRGASPPDDPYSAGSTAHPLSFPNAGQRAQARAEVVEFRPRLGGNGRQPEEAVCRRGLPPQFDLIETVDVDDRPALDEASFARLLVALLGIADTVVDVGDIVAALDLDGDHVAVCAGGEALPDDDVGV